MTMYRMGMLGDFDRSVFASEFESSLFGGYTFFVVIVMTNVLIAIVSDSYGARFGGVGGVCCSLCVFEL